jgi:capsule polysaccharide export protein KpsE/RkpR
MAACNHRWSSFRSNLRSKEGYQTECIEIILEIGSYIFRTSFYQYFVACISNNFDATSSVRIFIAAAQMLYVFGRKAAV